MARQERRSGYPRTSDGSPRKSETASGWHAFTISQASPRPLGCGRSFQRPRQAHAHPVPSQVLSAPNAAGNRRLRIWSGQPHSNCVRVPRPCRRPAHVWNLSNDPFFVERVSRDHHRTVAPSPRQRDRAWCRREDPEPSAGPHLAGSPIVLLQISIQTSGILAISSRYCGVSRCQLVG